MKFAICNVPQSSAGALYTPGIFMHMVHLLDLDKGEMPPHYTSPVSDAEPKRNQFQGNFHASKREIRA